jgi:uncharacterized protein YndB with AHSA1/START domain
MSSRSVHHDTFVIERTYPSSPSRVFQALTDPAAKAQWFLPPGEWKASDYRFDCRVGGTEHVESRPPGGEPHVYDAVYHDVLADRRVVFSYDMHLGEQHLSVSLTTIELVPVEGGTQLTFTEQGAYLDGDPASVTSRVEGTHWLLDNLGSALAEAEATTAG